MTKAFILTAAVSAGLAFGQGYQRGNGGNPPDPQQRVQRRVEALTRFLSLNDSQKAQATTIFTGAETQSETVRTTLRSTNEAIAAAVKKNDTGSIDQLAATAGTASGQLISIEGKANAAFYAILNPDQQAKFPVGGLGFGGPGGPGRQNFGGPHRGGQN